jgi:hypothetical protein
MAKFRPFQNKHGKSHAFREICENVIFFLLQSELEFAMVWEVRNGCGRRETRLNTDQCAP